jgi:hypothetical protein
MINRTLLACIAGALLSAPSLVAAQNGAFEINQTCALKGCFPGDDPGFPITINAPGVYGLTSNLDLDNPNLTAIQIAVEDVVLNLQNFTIDATNRCTGDIDDCKNKILAGYGVVSGEANVVVKNGVVKGFGFRGISLQGDFSEIHSVSAQHNYRAGIRVNDNSTVTGSNASFNGYLGFEGGASRFHRITATKNGQFAVTATTAHIDQAVVVGNAGTGMYVSRCLITDSVIARNGLGLWSIEGGNRVIDSQISENEGLGIFLQPAIAVDLPSKETLVNSFSGLSLFENNGGNDNPQIGGSGGLWESLGPNLCGRDTNC